MTETPDLDNSPAMCEAHPDDCPNGPDPHPFVHPDLAMMCCCKQPWEETADGVPRQPGDESSDE